MKKLLIFMGFSWFLLSEVFVYNASAQTFSDTETNNTHEETTQVVEATEDTPEIIETSEGGVEVLKASNEMAGLNNLLLQFGNLTQIQNPLSTETTCEDSIADTPQANTELGTEQNTEAIVTPQNEEANAE